MYFIYKFLCKSNFLFISHLIIKFIKNVNQVEVNCSNKDIIELGLGVARGKYNTDFIIDWIIVYSGD
jgi:death-on-curing protein